MLGLFYPYGIVLQAIAILHFIRRRPDTYWLFIILMGGGLGSLVYIFVEVLPDARLLGGAYQVFPRRKRIKALEAMVVDNPSVGNFEELGDLLLDDGQYQRARECFDKVLARTEEIDPRYRRGLAALALNDFAAAESDLAAVTAQDPKYDYQRAAGLRASSANVMTRSVPVTRTAPSTISRSLAAASSASAAISLSTPASTFVAPSTEAPPQGIELDPPVPVPVAMRSVSP